MKSLVLAAAVVCASASFCSAQIIYNGDFETGTLSGWTTFITPDGDLGPGLPVATQFDVTGNGTPSYAAEFQAGLLNLAPPGTAGGGGIYQSFTVGAGQYVIGADFAAENIDSVANFTAGVATVSIDSTTIETLDFRQLIGGDIEPGQIERSSFQTTMNLSAGTHQISIEFTRGFLNGEGYFGSTPLEFVDNVDVAPVPEPSIAALGMCGLAAVFFRRRMFATS